jgi:hypothetical protein
MVAVTEGPFLPNELPMHLVYFRARNEANLPSAGEVEKTNPFAKGTGRCGGSTTRITKRTQANVRLAVLRNEAIYQSG